MDANNKQVGGDHYKKFGDYQPWDVIAAWNLGYLEGTALKYIARWRDKGGVEDIKKAIHFLEKFLEKETSKEVRDPVKEAFQQYVDRVAPLIKQANEYQGQPVVLDDTHFTHAISKLYADGY